jgi:hypothetical protein
VAAQAILGILPLHKILPENHTAEDGIARQTKPFPRSAVGDANQNREFFGVQRLVQSAPCHDLVELDVTQLFISRHIRSHERPSRPETFRGHSEKGYDEVASLWKNCDLRRLASNPPKTSPKDLGSG